MAKTVELTRLEHHHQQQIEITHQGFLQKGITKLLIQ